ncbi:unnamed protein product, partial [Pleuronectes platessa]
PLQPWDMAGCVIRVTELRLWGEKHAVDLFLWSPKGSLSNNQPVWARCLGAVDPSVGFLLSLLRGPQRLLIIPDLLALPFSASHSGPLWLAQVSTLSTQSFLTLFAPSHVQNNPSS